MLINETWKKENNLLILNYSTDKNVTELKNMQYEDIACFHYDKLKQFIYHNEKIEENIPNFFNSDVSKLYLLELEIDTLENKPIVLYNNANNTISESYKELSKKTLSYINMLDKLAELSGNYHYENNGNVKKINGKETVKNINGLKIKDEEKGDFFADFDFKRYVGEKNQDFDYSSVIVTASLDGMKLFKIFNPLFRDKLLLYTIPLKYKVRLFKTNIQVWGQE